MWWWVGAGAALVASAASVPYVTGVWVRGERFRGFWLTFVSLYAAHAAFGVLGVWLLLKARG